MTSQRDPITEDIARSRIERAIWRAKAVLAWETVWPVLAPVLIVAAAFAIVSWAGLWRVVSDPVRYGILAGFAVLLVFLIARFFRVREPARAAALSRIEVASGLLHRPASALSDELAVGSNDAAAKALWDAHRTQLIARVKNLRTGIPSPGLAGKDPWALRFLAVLLLAVAFVYAGPERTERIKEAFAGGEPTETTIARIDAWVTPPTYTGRAPLFLTGPGARPEGSTYTVPVGSIVTVRTSGANDLSVVATGQATEALAEAVETDGARETGTDQPLERQVVLDTANMVTVRRGDRDILAWNFAVSPDAVPSIEFVGQPTENRSGALTLTYQITDDYGVIEARAEIAPPAGQDGQDARPLFEAPQVPLSLPQLRTRDGVGETIRDLTSHPWAGADVTITLLARDQADQEGSSAPLEITLPARRFSDPLARAVIEQRTRLALDANSVGTVADALDALTFAPEGFYDDNFGDYLALRIAYHRIYQARDDDDLRDLVDYLWAVALGIEDGDLSLAAQKLRDAQEALRQALENGASDEEIERLTQELREAMREFMQALAEEARRNPNMANMPPNPDMQVLRSQDLERMLDQIEDLARNGARDAARQLLSELQSMMENLQSGNPMAGNQQQNGEMNQMMNDLADMIRRQQELMDETHRTERGMGENGEPMTPEQMQEALRQLQEQQQGLEQALGDLMEQLEGMGMQPGEELGQAGEAMGRAAGELGEGQPGNAVGNQGEALEALRQGAQGMAQQMAEQGGPGMNGNPNGRQMPNEDPLGRPQRTVGPELGTTVKVPDEIDIQRAREILEAIRERLGDPSRSILERNYLERLLDQF